MTGTLIPKGSSLRIGNLVQSRIDEVDYELAKARIACDPGNSDELESEDAESNDDGGDMGCLEMKQRVEDDGPDGHVCGFD